MKTVHWNQATDLPERPFVERRKIVSVVNCVWVWVIKRERVCVFDCAHACEKQHMSLNQEWVKLGKLYSTKRQVHPRQILLSQSQNCLFVKAHFVERVDLITHHTRPIQRRGLGEREGYWMYFVSTAGADITLITVLTTLNVKVVDCSTSTSISTVYTGLKKL